MTRTPLEELLIDPPVESPPNAEGPSAEEAGDAPELSPIARVLHESMARGERPPVQYIRALLLENQGLREGLDRSSEIQEAMREEIERLCEPEQHTVVITALGEDEADHTVEVAAGHASRVRVSIAPTLDDVPLHVGQEGRLTRRRNCLVAVNGTHASWSEIGTFERRLGENRMLLKHRDTLLAMNAATGLPLDDLNQGDLVGFDPEVSKLAYEKVERPDHDHLFEHDVPEDDFAGLGGLDLAIAELKLAVSFKYENPDVASRYKVRKSRGILLYGPPGNGKTRLARCLANYVNAMLPDETCRFMAVAGSSDYSKWLGESEQRLKDRFRAAEEAARSGPVVIFFDEIDALAAVRGGARDMGTGPTSRICSTFLSQLDGINERNDVIVVAATNRKDVLDPALIRPGRIDRTIEIGAPNRAGARAILNAYLVDGPPLGGTAAEFVEPLLARVYSANGAFGELARVRTNDNRRFPIAARDLISGAMLENVVLVASEAAAVREIETGQVGVTLDDLTTALDAEILGKARMLSAGNAKSYVTVIPEEAHPIAVEPGDALR